uniref:Chloride channel protein n=1 Tax=Corethron hystrix TaxID=216773 RepID=A0A7S1G1U8_9STRA
MPTIFGGILSYVCAVLKPMPGQNEWITGLHTIGILEPDTFLQIFIISTLGMASGLSLGPELPLIITAGQVGSWVGLWTHQSILNCRILNLTCASAAIGAFFGFPMSGALFVLEVPHTHGLQFFEALSPATLASIVAVIVHKCLLDDTLDGYFNYPFLNENLPFHIILNAIVYGVFGWCVGHIYLRVVLYLKGAVHEWFHEPHHDHSHEDEINDQAHLEGVDAHEKLLLVGKPSILVKPKNNLLGNIKEIYVKDEPKRAALAGTIAGFVTGIICMHIPHTLFWGEAQLQNLIDRGHTPLPVFGKPGSITEDMVAWGYCNRPGFTIKCSGTIAVAKLFTTGLSLGTGIIGGHFWAPLFTAAAAAWFFNDFVTEFIPNAQALHQFPCVGLLCIMGSAHVVIYRAHMAIMLILTLTISNFQGGVDEGNIEPSMSDYSAVLPLLVIACYVSVILCKISDVLFYNQQRPRGDLLAIPEVLCEPKKKGDPIFPYHQQPLSFDHESHESGQYVEHDDSTDSSGVADPSVNRSESPIGYRFKKEWENREVSIINSSQSPDNGSQHTPSHNPQSLHRSRVVHSSHNIKNHSPLSNLSLNDNYNESNVTPSPEGRSQHVPTHNLQIPKTNSSSPSHTSGSFRIHRASMSLDSNAFMQKLSKINTPNSHSSARNKNFTRSSSNESLDCSHSLDSLGVVQAYGEIKVAHPPITEQAFYRRSTRKLPTLPSGRHHKRLSSMGSFNSVNSRDLYQSNSAIDSDGILVPSPRARRRVRSDTIE